eukprot:8420131-Pyramimonas_sp.AAC.1
MSEVYTPMYPTSSRLKSKGNPNGNVILLRFTGPPVPITATKWKRNIRAGLRVRLLDGRQRRRERPDPLLTPS